MYILTYLLKVVKSTIGPTFAGPFGLPGFISSYLYEVNIQILDHVTSNQDSLRLVSLCPLYRTVSVPVIYSAGVYISVCATEILSAVTVAVVVVYSLPALPC